MQQEASIVIERPPRAVFDVIAVHHFENHPRWDPNVIEMTPLTPPPIGIGSQAQVRRKRGGSDNEILEVTAFERDRRWQSRDNVGPFLLTMEALIEPIGQGSSRLVLRAETRASGVMRFVARLLKPVFAAQMNRSLGRIKQLVEHEEPASPPSVVGP
jgi:hypothetical protein